MGLSLTTVLGQQVFRFDWMSGVEVVVEEVRLNVVLVVVLYSEIHSLKLK